MEIPQQLKHVMSVNFAAKHTNFCMDYNSLTLIYNFLMCLRQVIMPHYICTSTSTFV